jgi:hypothetical protein
LLTLIPNNSSTINQQQSTNNQHIDIGMDDVMDFLIDE